MWCGWARFKTRTSSVFAVHLAPPTSDQHTPDISNILPSSYFENSVLAATLLKLQSVLSGSGIDDHAYVETLGLLLLWELMRAAGTPHPLLKQARGGLTALQLNRVKEFVDAQVADDIAPRTA